MKTTHDEIRLHRVALRRQLAERAIHLAMSNEWGQAVEVNRRLVEEFDPDAAAWNRLGKAYVQLERITEAYAAYEATLKLDPTNTIAQRQRTRLAANFAQQVPLPIASS